MAVRTTGTNSSIWDYHFMRKDSLTSNTWSFKAGTDGCVFRLKSGYAPNNVSWYAYKYNGTTWNRDYSIQYTSSIYYIVYK